MAKVTVNHVDKIFENGFQAVKDMNFVAEDKEFVILVGPSGCGKTTMLRMIAGLETITRGEIIIDDKYSLFFLGKKHKCSLFELLRYAFAHCAMNQRLAAFFSSKKMAAARSIAVAHHRWVVCW